MAAAADAGGRCLRVALLAGELSGDNLGAGLMRALNRLRPDTEIRFEGIGGPRMLEAGLLSLESMDSLAVNGFVDPLRRLPALWRLLRRLIRHFEADPPDVFIGVDFNVFNLLLERALKHRGIPTVHYVSPSVYAWRRGRAKRIERSADVLLALYPFEAAFYDPARIRVVYVGHPLADAIAPEAGSDEARLDARRQFGIDPLAKVIAVLPGSRRSEVELMAPDFLEALRLLRANHCPDLVALIPAANAALGERLRSLCAARQLNFVTVTDAGSRPVLTAADIALVKSGTSTLETMLLHRPMVVSYRLGRVTYHLARQLVRTPYVALPNILAGRALVPELLQDEATPARLAQALAVELTTDAGDRAAEGQRAAFVALHQQLRCDADTRAAEAVLELVAASG